MLLGHIIGKISHADAFVLTSNISQAESASDAKTLWTESLKQVALED